MPNVDTALVERLAKSPVTFSCSSFALQRKRKAYVLKLMQQLQIPVPPKLTMLYAVKNILRHVRRWPNHSRLTQQLSSNARALRKALLGAKEPDSLLFQELPKAVGFDCFDSEPLDIVVHAIVECIAEVDQCFAFTLHNMKDALHQTLNCGLSNVRSDLSLRADRIKNQILEPRLRAFALALADFDLPSEEDWLQRVGLSLLGRVPTEWIDADVQRFHMALKELAPSFRRIEAMHFQQQNSEQGGFTSIRLGLTTADGYDTQEVVSIPHSHIQDLEEFVVRLRAEASARFGTEGAVYALAQWARLELCKTSEEPLRLSEDSQSQLTNQYYAHG